VVAVVVVVVVVVLAREWVRSWLVMGWGIGRGGSWPGGVPSYVQEPVGVAVLRTGMESTKRPREGQYGRREEKSDLTGLVPAEPRPRICCGRHARRRDLTACLGVLWRLVPWGQAVGLRVRRGQK